MAGFATRRPDGATKVELLGDHDDGPPVYTNPTTTIASKSFHFKKI